MGASGTLPCFGPGPHGSGDWSCVMMDLSALTALYESTRALGLSDDLVGVLSAESSREDAFSEADEKLLTVLGTQAALAIVASRSRERLQQRIDQLNALYRISQLASEPHDLKGVLSAMLAITQEV